MVIFLSRLLFMMATVLLGTEVTARYVGQDQPMQEAQQAQQRERQKRRVQQGERKKSRSHVHKWKGHREQKGEKGDWKGNWHGGRGYTKHASHMWHKYGWFWDEDTKSWYQCTPTEDPARGYGCEYNGKWYSMVKEGQRARGGERKMRGNGGRAAARGVPGQAESTVVIEELPDEDVVEAEDANEWAMVPYEG